MKLSEQITLTVTDITEDGKGIGHADGMAVFIDGAVPGDTVRAAVTKVKKRYAFASLEEILTPSADRVEAACPYYGRCGGCTMMELSLESQHRIHREQIREKLQRIGGIEDPVVRDVIPCQTAAAPAASPGNALPGSRYRNKAVFAVLETKSGPVCGFRMRGSNRVIDIRDCLLQQEPVMAVCNAVRELIRGT
ncbi:MAG: class I SAM-dependent RNA methyltransferase [Mogibacterium sp.]|nr:class I SAM-dependent RNA methyltransferase [Mogibacterium sp.]